MSDEHHPEHLSDRLKELSHELEEQFTHIEQRPPRRPNFLLVVLLFGATIIVFFILAIFVLHLGGGKYGTHSVRHHPISQLFQPNAMPFTNTAVQLV